jgi:secreted PhoX family phosphatase
LIKLLLGKTKFIFRHDIIIKPTMENHMSITLSRRDFLKAGALTLAGVGGAAALAQMAQDASAAPPSHQAMQVGYNSSDAMPMMVGEVDHQRNGFNPSELLTDFDCGQVSTLKMGRPARVRYLRR